MLLWGWCPQKADLRSNLFQEVALNCGTVVPTLRPPTPQNCSFLQGPAESFYHAPPRDTEAYIVCFPQSAHCENGIGFVFELLSFFLL